jgi:hypothetical protein
MFQNAKPLDKVRHKDLKFTPQNNYLFARQIPVSILGASEIADAARHFPVVFWDTGDKNMPTLPQALMSIEKEKNAFVDEDGNWKAGCYVPAHIRRYPFILGQLPEKDRFAIMIAEDAPHFQSDEGTPIMNEDGETTDILKRATEFLGKYKQELERTMKLVQEIEKHDVLAPMNLKVSKGTATKLIKGFRTVNFQKVLELDDKILAQWVRTGAMGLIYAHMNSLSNLRTLIQMQGIQAENPNESTSAE